MKVSNVIVKFIFDEKSSEQVDMNEKIEQRIK